jgi:hypothetical protein
MKEREEYISLITNSLSNQSLTSIHFFRVGRVLVRVSSCFRGFGLLKQVAAYILKH